ncbi:MAG: porin family protein [Salibacteraceae bacterium]
MRNIKFYIIGLLFFGSLVNGVSQEDKKVALAFKVSPTFSWMQVSNNGYESNGTSAGIAYGLLMDFRLFGEKNYALASGLTFNHTSGKIVEPSYYSDSNSGMVYSSKSDAKYSMTYIDVPFAIRLKTNEIGYNTYYGEFGTEFGFRVNAKKKYTDTYSGGVIDEQTDDVSDQINWFRSSLIIGLGVQRNISGNTFYRVGVTYHNGLTNVLRGPGTGDDEGKAFLVDGNGNTVIENGAPVYDKKLSTKLKFIEVQLAIIF